MRQSSLAEHFALAGPPRVVQDSSTSQTASAYFEVWDSQAGTRAQALIGCQLQWGLGVVTVRKATANPGTPLCQRCYRWGHIATQCKQRLPCCPRCSEPHFESEHHVFASCYRGHPRMNPPLIPTPEGYPCPHQPRC